MYPQKASTYFTEEITGLLQDATEHGVDLMKTRAGLIVVSVPFRRKLVNAYRISPLGEMLMFGI